MRHLRPNEYLQEGAHLGGLKELLIDDFGTYGLLRDHNFVAALLGCREDRILRVLSQGVRPARWCR